MPDADGNGPRDCYAEGVSIAVERFDRNIRGKIEGFGKNAFVINAIDQAEEEQANDSELTADGEFTQKQNGEAVTDGGQEQENPRLEKHRCRQIAGKQLGQE